MAVTKYFCNTDKKEYWRVYAQKQSSRFKHIRFQKVIRKIPIEDEIEARRLEQAWLVKLARKVARKEAQGCCWDELLDRFELHYKRYPTKKMNSNTVLDHVSRARNYTAEWLSMPCSDINFGEACELFEELQASGLSQGLRKKIKGSISTVSYTHLTLPTKA